MAEWTRSWPRSQHLGRPDNCLYIGLGSECWAQLTRRMHRLRRSDLNPTASFELMEAMRADALLRVRPIIIARHYMFHAS
jgi:hypothetical protein